MVGFWVFLVAFTIYCIGWLLLDLWGGDLLEVFAFAFTIYVISWILLELWGAK